MSGVARAIGRGRKGRVSSPGPIVDRGNRSVITIICIWVIHLERIPSSFAASCLSSSTFSPGPSAFLSRTEVCSANATRLTMLHPLHGWSPVAGRKTSSLKSSAAYRRFSSEERIVLVPGESGILEVFFPPLLPALHSPFPAQLGLRRNRLGLAMGYCDQPSNLNWKVSSGLWTPRDGKGKRYLKFKENLDEV